MFDEKRNQNSENSFVNEKTDLVNLDFGTKNT